MIAEEKEELNENDQVKYKLELIKNNEGKVRELKIKYRKYPLLHKGWWNYEELDIELKRHGKYTRIEIYFLRMNWNGSGYFPICSTKLQIDDSFFDISINDNNVKEVVIRSLRELKGYLENGECEHALKYFPE